MEIPWILPFNRTMYLHVPNNSSIFICVSVIKKNLKHSQNYPLKPGKYNSEVKTFTRNRIPRFLVPQIRGADSWFNFLIRGKNRFSSAIRLSSTPFAIPRAPTLGIQPSFFFFTWFPLFYLFTRTTHNFCQWFISTWRVYSFVSPFSRLRSFRNALLPEFR